MTVVTSYYTSLLSEVNTKNIVVMQMTFAFSPTQVDILFLRQSLSLWLNERVWERNNAMSAYHGLQNDIDDFSVFPLLTQATMNLPSGVEGVMVAGVPAPVIPAEIEVSPIEVSIETIFHKNPIVENLLSDFAPSEFVNAVYDFFIYLRDFKGGFYIQNCVPQRVSLQFNEGNIATLSSSFVGNYVVFFPQGSVEFGGSGSPPTDILCVANFSTVLSVSPLASVDANFALRILSLSLNVTNNITLSHAIPFEDFVSVGFSKARRAPRLFNIGYQTLDLTFRALAPENVIHSIAQYPVPIKEVSLSCYDATMEHEIGTFTFSGKYADWRVTTNPQSQVQVEWRYVGAGVPLWTYTPA